MKTNELTGAALDWAVAKCENRDFEAVESFLDYYDEGGMHYAYDWSQGGPIIEREKIDIVCLPTRQGGFVWRTFYADGPTALVAAMRCYVASKLGDNVDIPKELT